MLGMVKNLVRRKKRTPKSTALTRQSLAAAYLRGSGLEIGALHQPLPVPAGVTVRYVDRLPVEGLRRHYPELREWNLVPVDFLDDGEHLRTVPDGSQDFVIANHFLEHCEDPIGTLKAFRRVLRPGGVLYLAVPDKRFTFDLDRPLTTLDHLQRDHDEGPNWSRRQHVEEWVRLVNKAQGEAEVARQVADIEALNYSIHYHVWDQRTWLGFVQALQSEWGFEIETFLKAGIEIITVLRF